MTSSKISVYSLTDLKSTLDDHLPIFLTSPNLLPTSTPLPRHLRFTQSYFRTIVRLALGYTAVALALYIFYLDYYLKVPWREHKTITAWCVLGYGILNVCMFAWSASWGGGEGGLIFEGSRKGVTGQSKGKKEAAAAKLRVYSYPPHRKYDPTYRLVVYSSHGTSVAASTRNGGLVAKGGAIAGGSTGGASGSGEEKRDLTVPFTSFFQADGTFVSGEFERWLRGQLPEILGEADQASTPAGAEAARDDKTAEDGDVIRVQTPGNTTSREVDEPSTRKRNRKRG